MKLHLNKIQTFDVNMQTATAAAATAAAPTAAASPPDFDFNLPCRYFKSSFARSLSLNSASNHCKSLDLEMRSKCSNNNDNSSKIVAVQNSFQQRLSRVSTPTITSAANGTVSNNLQCNSNRNGSSNSCNNNSNILALNKVTRDSIAMKPPAMQTRRLSAPVYNLEFLRNLPQQQQQQQQHVPLTQFAVTAAENSHATNAQQPLNNNNSNHHNNKNNNNSSHHNNKNNNNSSHHNNKNNNNKTRRNTVWSRDGAAGEQSFELSDEAADVGMANISDGVYMLGAERCQQHPSSQQHNQQQRALYEPQRDDLNVEAVLLQNRLDTLQWQLKQVETSCEMYRAVMEEVARFLERYHIQKQEQLLKRTNVEQITRSKSMHHVCAEAETGEDHDNAIGNEKRRECQLDAPVVAYSRARSSTNLLDVKPKATNVKTAFKKPKQLKNSMPSDLYEPLPPTVNNYNAFKDYTWRRSPKKQADHHTDSSDTVNEQKLNQEAFRLSRTIHNLLNTSLQQPDLTQHHTDSLSTANPGRRRTLSVCTGVTVPNQPQLNSSSITSAGSDSSSVVALETSGSKSSTHAEMLFLRSLNMRDSRLSLRSSTDSSVHSTSSSSKLETDEEPSPFTPPMAHMPTAPKPIPQLGSTTEDESGFSSISSFQDIGVPLSSTMISTRNSLAGEANEAESTTLRGFDFNLDSRNSTLKGVAHPPSTPIQIANLVGVPLDASAEMQHRWDSPSKTYRNTTSKFQRRFSTLSNEEASSVLWV